MIINRTNLSNLTTGYKTTFADALTTATLMYTSVATVVPSATAIETYAWLTNMPGMREWIGDRLVKQLETEAYLLKNRLFEDTVAVPRTAIEDDQYGVYTPAIRMMAEEAALNPEKLIFTEALPNGFTAECYDGQPFFDADHPVRLDGLNETSFSNVQAGAGPAWYLLCTKRPVKPFLYQNRISPELIVKDDPNTSDDVFNRDEFRYGTRSRGAAGYAFWQMAFASKADLDRDSFEDAYFKGMEIKKDGGQPAGIVYDTLLVPPRLAKAAREVVEVQRLANGADNPNYQIVEVKVVPWLS